MIIRRLLYMLGAALALVGCKGEPKAFHVNVNVPTIGTQQISVIYTTDDGNRRSMSMPAVNGSFKFSGQNASVAIIETYTTHKQLLFALLAKNGDKIKLTANDNGEYVVEGNNDAQLLVNYKPGNDTIGFPYEVRKAIDVIYKVQSREDWPKFRSPELIVGKNRLDTFACEGIWVFTASKSERTKSVLDTIRKHAALDAPVRDVFVGTDTVNWRVITRKDSANWTQAMLPNGPLALDSILTSTPVLVQVDSLGSVIRVQRLQ